MNDEKLIKANELAVQIERVKNHLKRAKESVVPAYSGNGNTWTLPVNPEIRAIIKAITIAAIEKDLAELDKQYADL